MKIDLNKLNCMNYCIHDHEGDWYFAQQGLRSLYNWSKRLDISFKELCMIMGKEGQIVFGKDKVIHTITMI